MIAGPYCSLLRRDSLTLPYKKAMGKVPSTWLSQVRVGAYPGVCVSLTALSSAGPQAEWKADLWRSAWQSLAFLGEEVLVPLVFGPSHTG